MEQHSFIVSWLFYDLVRRCFRFVNEVRIENVELGV